MNRNLLSVFLAISISILMLAFSGCDSSDDSDDSTPAATDVYSSFYGSWALYAGGTPSGAIEWYVHFNTDKSWTISRNADKSDQIVYGTYTVSSSGFLEGAMVNPGVGDGKIECTISGDVITMDFIEYWWDPAKHLPYAGRKI